MLKGNRMVNEKTGEPFSLRSCSTPRSSSASRCRSPRISRRSASRCPSARSIPRNSPIAGARAIMT